MFQPKSKRVSVSIAVLGALALAGCRPSEGLFNKEDFATARSLCARELGSLSRMLAREHNTADVNIAFERAQRSIEIIARVAGFNLLPDTFTREYQPGPHSNGGTGQVLSSIARCDSAVSNLGQAEMEQVREIVTYFADAQRLHLYLAKQG